MNRDWIKWIVITIAALVILGGSVFSVLNYFKKPPEFTYVNDNIEILYKLDSLQTALKKIDANKTIIKEKFYETKYKIAGTNNLDSLITLFWQQYWADTAGFNKPDHNYW